VTISAPPSARPPDIPSLGPLAPGSTAAPDPRAATRAAATSTLAAGEHAPKNSRDFRALLRQVSAAPPATPEHPANRADAVISGGAGGALKKNGAGPSGAPAPDAPSIIAAARFLPAPSLPSKLVTPTTDTEQTNGPVPELPGTDHSSAGVGLALPEPGEAEGTAKAPIAVRSEVRSAGKSLPRGHARPASPAMPAGALNAPSRMPVEADQLKSPGPIDRPPVEKDQEKDQEKDRPVNQAASTRAAAAAPSGALSAAPPLPAGPDQPESWMRMVPPPAEKEQPVSQAAAAQVSVAAEGARRFPVVAEEAVPALSDQRGYARPADAVLSTGAPGAPAPLPVDADRSRNATRPAAPPAEKDQPVNQAAAARVAAAAEGPRRTAVLAGESVPSSTSAPAPRELAFAARLTQDATTAEPAAPSKSSVLLKSNVPSTLETAVPAEPAVPAAPSPADPRANSIPELSGQTRERSRASRDAAPEPAVVGQTASQSTSRAFTVSAEPAAPARAASPERSPAASEPPAAHVPDHAEPPALNPARASGPARDIALRLAGDEQTSVEVRVTERAGEVRVAVRSATPEVAQSMRAGLSELAQQLGARGFNAEIWRPEPAASTARTGSESSFQHQSRDGGPSHQEHGHQQRRNPHQPAWLDELESSFTSTHTLNRSTQS
jgi:hypothetical protein